MKRLYRLRFGIRTAGGIALLFVAWHHAHWSVALSLTLLGIAEEARSILAERKIDRDQQLAAEMKAAFVNVVKKHQAQAS